MDVPILMMHGEALLDDIDELKAIGYLGQVSYGRQPANCMHS